MCTESGRWEMKEAIKDNSLKNFANEGDQERENNNWREFCFVFK